MEELTIGDLQNVTCLYNKFNNHQIEEYKVPNVCIPKLYRTNDNTNYC